VLFANFAEAMAEGRGKAQADSLRKARRDIQAKRLAGPRYGAKVEQVSASTLRKGDVVLDAGDSFPGRRRSRWARSMKARPSESAPVIRESGGDRSAVTGGTRCSPIG
jgi:K+-transporting ATPase ATPase B chain